MRVRSLKELGKVGWSISPKYAGVLEQAKKAKPRAKGSPPHDLLWAAVSARLPNAVRESENAVPGRAFRLDIAIVSASIL